IAQARRGQHLLLDEPTNHLDIRYQHEVLALVRSLGVTTMVVLHDLNLAARYYDDLTMLDRGHVAATDTAEEILEPDLIHRVYGIHADRHQIAARLRLSFTLQPEAELAQKGTRL